MSYDADVFVVGGGPAGLAAAIAASARGFRVIVADGAAPPIAKACGEGLLSDGFLALRSLGVELQPSDGYALRGIHFEDADTSVCGPFPNSRGMGVRRETLHLRMLERAQEYGVQFLWNAPVTIMDRDSVIAGGVRVRARWIVGADGGRSRVRAWSGLNHVVFRNERPAFRQHFHVKPWSEYVEIYWAEKAQVYVTPVGVEEICVALISDRPKLRVQEALQSFPKLASRLDGAGPTSSERGAVTSTFKLQRVSCGKVALIGDASGGVDAITGEGLCLSFRQAAALADALAKNNLDLYETAHRRLCQRARLIGKLLLLLDRSTAIRKRTLRAMEAAPYLFEGMLAYHMGATHHLRLAATGALLGWRLLTV